MSYFASCKGGGSGGGGSTEDAPPAGQTFAVADNIEYKTFAVNQSVTVGQLVTLNLEITIDDNSLVFYQINDHEDAKFKPNSGIIVPNNKKGTLITTLETDEPGTYNFSVTLTNTKNQKLVNSFTTTIIP